MSKPKPYRKTHNASPPQSSSRRVAAHATTAPPTVSGRWLLSAFAIALLAAILCAWGTLCILFWQGSWQLLYHPTSAVTKTPANVNLPFESVGFATNASGDPQLRGWWIPAASQPRFTAVYLHSQTGNLAQTVNDLKQLHEFSLDVFAFDYRGYGQSRFEHPGEKRWREDAESALRYLTATRHITPASIVLIGRDLGANLALEVAVAHPDLAGVVLEQPGEHPTAAIFNDARARLVPAHLLVRDRWDTDTAASSLLIPSLWFYVDSNPPQNYEPGAYRAVPAHKTIVWLTNSPDGSRQISSALSAFLDELRRPSK